jgi:hypothetical protein
MKKLMLAACLLASAGSFAAPKANLSTYSVNKSGDGQHIPASQVPALVKRDKNARYPGSTNTRWELESEHGMKTYKADFIKANGQRTKAEWLADGTFLGEK